MNQNYNESAKNFPGGLFEDVADPYENPLPSHPYRVAQP